MKKIVILGWYGQNNLGDDAILLSIIQNLKQIENTQFTVLSSNPGNIKKYEAVRAVKYLLPFSLFTMINELRNSDIFILGGGGLLFDQSKTLVPRNMIIYLFPPLLAKLFNKPIATYAIGIGPIYSRLGRAITKFALDHFDLITVRDIGSIRILEEIGISKQRILMTLDPVLGLTPEDSDVIISKEKINLNDRKKLIIMCPTSLNNYKFSERSQLISTFANICDYIISTLKSNLIFIPMWRSPLNNRDDRSCIEEILSKMKFRNNANVIENSYEPKQILAFMQKADLVIGIRLHSLILAANAEVPMIGLVYDSKVKFFMESIGQEKYMINLENINYCKITKLINEACSNSLDIKYILKLKLEQMDISNEKTKIFTYIRGFL